MRQCNYYRILGQLVGHHTDNGQKDLASLKVKFPSELEGSVALIGTPNNLELVRLQFPVEADAIPEELGEPIAQLFENVLCGIRLGIDPEATYAHPPGNPFFSVWNFVDAGTSPSLGLKIDAGEAGTLDPQNALNLAQVAGDELIACRLLADGRSLRLPAQYRFLSLFKILELYYREPSGAWSSEFEALLDAYRSDFVSLKTGRASLKKVMFECRDKCAHIRTGRLRSVGVFGADATPSRLLLAVTPLLQKMAAHVINQAAAANGSSLRIVQGESL